MTTQKEIDEAINILGKCDAGFLGDFEETFRYQTEPWFMNILRDSLEFYRKHRWQPIETAPKDGTRILIANSVYVEKARWAYCCERFEGDEWRWLLFECEDGYYNVTAEPNEPTRWMPIPEFKEE